MRILGTVSLIAGGLAGAPAMGECGFCAQEVALSEPLAACYLDRLDSELKRATAENAEIYLVELATCGSTRAGNPMPEPRVGDAVEEIEVDDAFLIPVTAMRCLAEKLRATNFDSETQVVVVEVPDDC